MPYGSTQAKPGEAKASEGFKRCSTCQEKKPLEAFSRNKRQPDGYQNVCSACKHDYWNRWHRANYENPEYRNRLNTNQIRVMLARCLKKYGVTIEQYTEMVAKGCGICGGPPNGTGRYHFDHDHDTGKFRGLLCSHCNTGIGLLKDDPTMLARAIEYLKRASEIAE